MRERKVRSAPARRTAVTFASDFSAISAATSKDVMDWPAIAARVSRNRTKGRPLLASRTSVRTSSGLAGSSTRASAKRRKSRAGQLLAARRFDHESRGRLHEREQDRRVQPGDMIDRNDVRRPDGNQIFSPRDFEPEQEPPRARAEQNARMFAGSRRKKKIAAAMLARPRTRSAIGSLNRTSCNRIIVASDPLDDSDVAERVDRGDDARAPIDARPGLNRGEQRDDIEAQGCREQENFDGKAHASGAHEKFGNRNLVAGGRYRLGRKPHVKRQRRYRDEEEWRRRKLDAAM